MPLEPEHWDGLEPLWRALYDHHNEVSPDLLDRALPFEQSWSSRRLLEQRWLEAEPDTFALAAQDDDGDNVGYALVRVRSGTDFAVSWSFSDPLAFLTTLVVRPALRGHGLGSALLDAVEARLGDLGIADLVIEAIATNADAIKLYQRRGAVPYACDLIQRVRPAGPRTEA